ncbi:MAG: hypothetical protein ACJ788_21610 [Ktedonobacteraceae bacterium]
MNLCFKAGCDTLVDIADDIIKSVPGLTSNGSLHITRAEYDVACEQLRSVGVPLKADREASWRAFVSMRSQYDIPLLALANLVFAPKAPWSSDRKIEPVKRKQSR